MLQVDVTPGRLESLCDWKDDKAGEVEKGEKVVRECGEEKKKKKNHQDTLDSTLASQRIFFVSSRVRGCTADNKGVRVSSRTFCMAWM